MGARDYERTGNGGWESGQLFLRSFAIKGRRRCGLRDFCSVFKMREIMCSYIEKNNAIDHLFIHPLIHPPTHLSVHPSIHALIYSPTYPSTRSSMQPASRPPIYPSIHLPSRPQPPFYPTSTSRALPCARPELGAEREKPSALKSSRAENGAQTSQYR